MKYLKIIDFKLKVKSDADQFNNHQAFHQRQQTFSQYI